MGTCDSGGVLMQSIDRHRAESFIYLLCCWLTELDDWPLIISANDARELLVRYTHDWHPADACMDPFDSEPNSLRMDTLDMHERTPPEVP